MRLHHLGKVVKNLEEELVYYKKMFGLEKISGPVIDPLQKVRVVFIEVGFGKDITIELIEPSGEDSPVLRFLEKGGGLHHLCFEVDDIIKSTEEFKSKGAIVLGEPLPGKGHEDHLTTWLYTTQKELVELVEKEKKNYPKLENCKNFSEVVYYQSIINPDKVFIFDLSSVRSYTFGEFNSIVQKTAFYLVSQGVGKGDKVTAVIENSPEYCFLYFAALRVGAIFNPMPFTSHQAEVLKNVAYVEPKVIFIDSRKFSDFRSEKGPFIEVQVGKERLFEKNLNQLNSDEGKRWEIREEQPACLYYSSGTTGEPKGVLFSHLNMIANISSICRGFGFGNNEKHLVFLPLGHTASINYSLLPCLYAGGQFVLAENFWQIRNRFWELIEKEKITYLEVVPTILYSLLNIYQDTGGSDISSVRFVGCGSAPLQKSIQIEFQKRFGLKVANLYGLSETGPTHIDHPLKEGWQPGTIGVPLDVNEIKIFDENDRELGTNEIGEIVARGPNVFVGYYKNEKLYQEVVRNGYFYTGDVGYKDENGNYFYFDRIKDLIIKGGSNIAPNEIDEVLLAHPSIKECVTIGVPDEMFGEEIKSFVVLKDNCFLTQEEIKDHCKKYLSSLKIPKYIEFVTEIPKTHSGKLLRKIFRTGFSP